MPVYVCYRGESAHPALLAEGRKVFVIRDAQGRAWHCADSGLPEVMYKHHGGDPARERLDALWRTLTQGLHGEGAEVQLIHCQDETSLRQRLLQGTDPSPKGVRSESQGRQTMLRTNQVIPVPIRIDEHGDARVGDSQVLLDTVIGEYANGAEADSIVRAYDALQIADVHAVLAYYLRNREEVDAFLSRRREVAEALRKKIEADQPDRAGLREKLLARRAGKEPAHASPAE